MKRRWVRFPFSSGTSNWVEPRLYPMDTAWLDDKIPADHYRHIRPAYYRESSRKGLVQETKDDAVASDPELARGDD
jgi:hypothetical protein